MAYQESLKLASPVSAFLIIFCIFAAPINAYDSSMPASDQGMDNHTLENRAHDGSGGHACFRVSSAHRARDRPIRERPGASVSFRVLQVVRVQLIPGACGSARALPTVPNGHQWPACGWGKDFFMAPGTHDCDGDSVILPGYDRDGSVVVALCLQAECMEDFKKSFYEDTEMEDYEI